MFKPALVSFALLLAAPAYADGDQGRAPAFKDVRIGENPGASRVVVVCADWCDGSVERDGRVFLSGVGGTLQTDLAARGGYIKGLAITPVTGGAFLSVKTADRPARVALSECGDKAVCVDFHHQSTSAKPVPVTPAAARPSVTKPAQTATAPEQLPEIPPPPPLEPVEKQTAPQISPAIRATTLRGMSGAIESDNVNDARDDFHRDLEAISPEPLTEANCAGAEARLAGDGWDLNAYRLLALCIAKDGDLDKSDQMLARLQQLEPEDELAGLARPMIAAVAQAGALSGRRSRLR